MARDLYVYDVFDIDTEAYILAAEPLGKVTEVLGIDKPRVLNAVKYGQKIRKRYIISRTYLDGTVNPNDADDEFEIPEDLRQRWDEARFLAKKFLTHPRARVAK